ncbi:MAG: cytochrome c oxidase assembly protein [Alphaproteobacteria bacterium]
MEQPIDHRKKQNQRLMLQLFAGVLLMIGLSYASVPLYDLFCRVTGYGGTTQRVDAENAPVTADQLSAAPQVTIRFDANVMKGLDWEFLPPAAPVQLSLGEAGIVSYQAMNIGNKTSEGVATFNVTPQKAGIYFMKTQCFCFDVQSLTPGQKVDMPVYFYVDPAMADDKNMKDVNTITLSYSFFESE